MAFDRVNQQPLAPYQQLPEGQVGQSVSLGVNPDDAPPAYVPYDVFDENIAERHPKVKYCAPYVAKASNNILENLGFPVVLGIALHLVGEVSKCQSENNENNANKNDAWIKPVLTAFVFLYAFIHLSRAAYKAVKSNHNHTESLIEEHIASREKIEAMHSTKSHKAVQLLGATTAVSVTSAAVLFSQSQFESGTAAAYISLAAYLFRSYLVGKDGENNYREITGAEYKQIMTSAQKRAIAGGLATTAVGAIAFAVTNHLVTSELKTGGTNPHQISALASQAVLIAGIAMAGSCLKIRGTDATEQAIETKAAGVFSNRATVSLPLFGTKLVRRDLKNIALATIDTMLASAMAVCFSVNPAGSVALVPFLLGALGLSYAANTTVNSYTSDLDAVTIRLRNKQDRIQPEAEVLDNNGGVAGYIRGCFGR